MGAFLPAGGDRDRGAGVVLVAGRRRSARPLGRSSAPLLGVRRRGALPRDCTLREHAATHVVRQDGYGAGTPTPALFLSCPGRPCLLLRGASPSPSGPRAGRGLRGLLVGLDHLERVPV